MGDGQARIAAMWQDVDGDVLTVTDGDDFAEAMRSFEETPQSPTAEGGEARGARRQLRVVPIRGAALTARSVGSGGDSGDQEGVDGEYEIVSKEEALYVSVGTVGQAWSALIAIRVAERRWRPPRCRWSSVATLESPSCMQWMEQHRGGSLSTLLPVGKAHPALLLRPCPTPGSPGKPSGMPPREPPTTKRPTRQVHPLFLNPLRGAGAAHWARWPSPAQPTTPAPWALAAQPPRPPAPFELCSTAPFPPTATACSRRWRCCGPETWC